MRQIDKKLADVSQKMARSRFSSFLYFHTRINAPTAAVALCYCNCNYILFTKLPWPGDSKGIFRSSSQAATCPPVYHTQWRLHTVPFNAERQAGKL